MVLAEKPVIADSSSQMEPALLDIMLANISTLASVYHKPPETFVSRTRLAVQRADDLQHAPYEEDNISVVPSDGGAQPGTAGSVLASAANLDAATHLSVVCPNLL